MDRLGTGRIARGAAVAAICLAMLNGFCAPALASAAAKAGHAEASDSPYMALEQMPVSIIHNGRGKGLLVVEIGLNAPSLEDRHEIERLSPRLRDLYIQVLNLYASRDLRSEHPPNADVVAGRLQQATDQILGPDKAQVLLRQIIIRRTQ